MPAHSPRLLSDHQRAQLTQIPMDLPDREIARLYTFSTADLAIIRRRRRPHNKLGFAVQLAVLRFPGRTLADIEHLPDAVLAYLAHQVDVPVAAFVHYGQRDNTIYEHLDELQRSFGFQTYSWRSARALYRHLIPSALETNRALPLVEIALEFLRDQQIIAPGITTIERLIWRLRRRATRTIQRIIAARVTAAQRQTLDQVLQPMGTAKRPRATRLQWLREPPGTVSTGTMQHLVERLQYLQQLQLAPLPPQLHRTRVQQLASRGASYGAGPLASFAPERRYSFLLPYLHDLRENLVDLAIDLFDQLLTELVRKSETSQEQQVVAQARDLTRDLHTLADAIAALLHAEDTGLEPFATVFAQTSRDQLTATVTRVQAQARPADFDYLDLLEPKYVPLRKSLLGFYRALRFQSFRQRNPALLALDHVVALDCRNERVRQVVMKVGRTRAVAPLAHLSDRWRRYALHGETINANYYEAAAFERLKAEVRSGDIAIAESRRYRPFDSYLLPKPYWQDLCQHGETRLAVTDAASYLDDRATRIHEQLHDLQATLGETSGVTVDAAGQLHLTPLTKAVPPAAKRLSRRLYRMLPRPDLADLLWEVDSWTGFLSNCTHLSTGLPMDGADAHVVLAALMGQGMNLGMHTMAAASDFSYGQLAWAADWYLRDNTLLTALTTLDTFLMAQDLPTHWGDGTASTSDGLRVQVGVRTPNAQRNQRFFHDARGITIYLHMVDMGPPYRQRVITTNHSEAWHVIDALCHHDLPTTIQEHSTDTGGSSEHVFGMCALLGFRFAPRLADILNRPLVTHGATSGYGPLDQLIKGRANTRLIRDHWNEACHVAASIKHGAVPASVMMAKLAAYPRQNQVAQTVAEIGRLDQTIHTLDYLRHETTRRRIETRLNRHESANGLGRALLFGQRGILRERTFHDQMRRASSLVVLMAAIMVWNTVYLTDAIATLRGQGEDISDDLLAHIAPLGWGHLNLLGRYRFMKRRWSFQDRRPLRNEADIALEQLLPDDGSTPHDDDQ